MTLDTNIIIAYLDGEGEVVRALSDLKSNGVPFFLSSIVEAELLSFSRWTDAERRATQSFLEQNFISIAFDRTVARIAAHVRRSVKSVKLPDAAIAATALYTNIPLVTRNAYDFRGIAGLSIASF
ncbi:type II toxin-antitoxin system VapC family toxin [Patescibacteria group bacterium]|nr:type II toxin-antitoxin system VapC family toxin [Patescibacteria group bacterium]MDE2173562.1 type II toxin-antitoxin system VapC family toxin [Patescibacteria group bacterium]